MRLTRMIIGFAVTAACLTGTPAYSDAHGAHSGAHRIKPTATTGKPQTTTMQLTRPSAKPAKKLQSPIQHSPTVASPKDTKKTTTGTTLRKTGSQSRTTSTPLNPIAAKISSKPQFNAKIATMLPPRMTLNQASKGFKNQGQFIAALHVSQNTGIPFRDLKTDMTRKHMSLGQSIQDLKKSASPTVEVRKAEHEADDDVRNTTWRNRDGTEFEDHESERHESERRESERRSVARQISSNTQLAARVQAILPAGMTLSQAASGFASERQFLSALHAAKDLSIPFAQLRSEMTGHDHDSLVRAVQELKPTADAATAARAAQAEAAADIKTTTPRRADHDDAD